MTVPNFVRPLDVNGKSCIQHLGSAFGPRSARFVANFAFAGAGACPDVYGFGPALKASTSMTISLAAR